MYTSRRQVAIRLLNFKSLVNVLQLGGARYTDYFYFYRATPNQNARLMSGLRDKRLLFFALFFVFSTGIIQAQHPVWQNFGINDGLPSKAIYAMMLDSRGFLWVGASQGICRFNGYEFMRPVDTSASAGSSALYIVEDNRGRIWFNRLDGKLWIIENDSVRAWPYNNSLKSFLKKSKFAHRFAVDAAGAVWVGFWDGGILIVQPDGSQQVVSGQDKNALLFTEIDGRVLCASESNQDAAAEADFSKHRGQTNEVLQWKQGNLVSFGPFALDYSAINGPQFSMWPLSKGNFIGCFFQTYYLLENNKLIWHGQRDNGAKDVIEDIDGSILMAIPNGPNTGLWRFPSIEHFKRNEFQNLLPGKQAVKVVRDMEGGWWVATSNSGLYYCKNLKLGLFDQSSGLPDATVSALTSDGHNRIYAGLQQLDIVVVEREGGYPQLLPKAPLTELQALRFDTISNRLWAANNLCFLENNRWVFAQKQGQPNKIDLKISIKKISPDVSGTRWWASSNIGVFLIDPRSPLVNCNPLNALSGIRTYSVSASSDAENTLWITTMDGLLLWQDGQLTKPFFKHPVLRFNPLNVEFLPPSVGGGQVMALVSSGLLIRDQKGQFTHLTTDEGLSANMFNDIDVSPDGVIYACSNAGLNILRRKTNGQWHIETLSIKHGLPSNQVNDVAFLGNEIWIATDGGLVQYRGKPTPAPMPTPILEKFVVNNRPLVFSENLHLPNDQNNLAVRFFSLHYRSGGDIPYRYRLLGADTAFVYTHTREVNFANLSSGQYTFEVQAQNEDGQWSESARWAFLILPPWWATWWFRLFVGATLVVALYLVYRNRLQSIRHKAAEREKTRDLETAALRAQMNPHFIFNCLQAIQSFIVQNDRDAATTYLARFAKLVRLALHGSVDGLHSLAEEIAMLDNYLHLEQMRFKGKFEFSIRAEGLDLDDISLPPMLVQPFVENALIHGLQNLESQGRLEVIFTQKDNALEVLVRDNGPGFLEKGVLEKASHKSVGMMLTQKRLDMLMSAGKAGAENLTRETVLDADGRPVGARVQFLIPI